MRVDQFFPVVIYLIYFVIRIKNKGLFVFPTKKEMVLLKQRNLSFGFMLFRFISIASLVTSLSLIMLGVASVQLPFLSIDLVTLLLGMFLFYITSMPLDSKSGRDYIVQNLIFYLLQSLSFFITIFAVVVMYEQINLKGIINIQNSQFMFLPKWNLFIMAPLAFTFVSNYLLLRNSTTNFNQESRLIEDTYSLLLEAMFILFFIVLFCGGFFSFGNLDSLITHQRLLDLVLVVMSGFKFLLIYFVIKKLESVYPVLRVYEKLDKVLRNTLINLAFLIFIIVAKVAQWF